MAVRTNIGKVAAAISEGRRAFNATNFGPIVPASIAANEGIVSDFGVQTINPYLFIAGVHKWASTTLKVSK